MPKYKIKYDNQSTDIIYFKNHQELENFKANTNNIISVKLLNGFTILPNIDPHLTNSAIYNSEQKNG